MSLFYFFVVIVFMAFCRRHSVRHSACHLVLCAMRCKLDGPCTFYYFFDRHRSVYPILCVSNFIDMASTFQRGWPSSLFSVSVSGMILRDCVRTTNTLPILPRYIRYIV